jgi:hypothetical protein
MTCPSSVSAQVVTFLPSAPLNDALFKKILADIEANGQTLPVPSHLTAAFGLTLKGETMMARQVAYLGDEKNNHTLVELGNENYLFSSANTATAYIYYVDKNRALIAALFETAAAGITILANQDARKGLETELTFLASIARRL